MSQVLRIDIDGKLTAGRYKRVLTALRLAGVRVLYVRIDRTANGWHIVVGVVRRLSAMGVVALQAMAGSDWKREAFNFRRARAWRLIPEFWRTRYNVLYSEHHREVWLMTAAKKKTNVRRVKGGLQFAVARRGKVVWWKVRRGEVIPFRTIADACGVGYEAIRVQHSRHNRPMVKAANGRFGVPFGQAVKLLEAHGVL